MKTKGSIGTIGTQTWFRSGNDLRSHTEIGVSTVMAERAGSVCEEEGVEGVESRSKLRTDIATPATSRVDFDVARKTFSKENNQEGVRSPDWTKPIREQRGVHSADEVVSHEA